MPPTDGAENVDRTLATYERAAARYAELWRPAPAVDELIGDLRRRLSAGARVLEIGSGPGFDARAMEALGLRVQRTDGARAFVDLMRAQGADARVVDVTRDELGTGFAAVFANAVLLHLTHAQAAAVLARLTRCVDLHGLLAITVKEGRGERWTSERLGLPRFFAYWTEAQLRDALESAGWRQLRFARNASANTGETWLQFTCELADGL